MKRLIIFLLIAVVLVMCWVRWAPSHQRLYVYKDAGGKTNYTNVLEEVPEDQRSQALAKDDLPALNTADYDDYVKLKSGQSRSWFGFLIPSKKKMPEEKAKSAH
jgi:hypothetical protein